MKRINKLGVVLTVAALSTLTWMNASANMAASCTSGTAKICFKVTANGKTESYCNTATSNVKDCQ